MCRRPGGPRTSSVCSFARDAAGRVLDRSDIDSQVSVLEGDIQGVADLRVGSVIDDGAIFAPLHDGVAAAERVVRAERGQALGQGLGPLAPHLDAVLVVGSRHPEQVVDVSSESVDVRPG